PRSASSVPPSPTRARGSSTPRRRSAGSPARRQGLPERESSRAMLTDLRSPGRALRQARVRRRVRGTNERPRLTVYRSLNHIYAQLISDESGATLAAASTLSSELKEPLAKASRKNKDAAHRVGQLIAAKAKQAGVTKVVFDRNGFLYHGRVKSLADGARESGL